MQTVENNNVAIRPNGNGAAFPNDEFQRLRGHLNERVLGQSILVDRLLIALLADGHLLVEGAPGLARSRISGSPRKIGAKRPEVTSASRRPLLALANRARRSASRPHE